MGLFDKIAEERIRKAIEEGEFNSLEGFGKPLDNSEYFNAPEENRIAWHILKNSGLVPEEVELRKTIYSLTHEIARETNSVTINKKMEQLERLRTKLLVNLEQGKKR
jgi:hypothetical protein